MYGGAVGVVGVAGLLAFWSVQVELAVIDYVGQSVAVYVYEVGADSGAAVAPLQVAAGGVELADVA